MSAVEPATAVTGAEGLRSLVDVELPPTPWTVMTRERPRVERGARGAEVEEARRGRGDAGADGSGHGCTKMEKAPEGAVVDGRRR